jgi:hypothetical protein
LHREFVKNGTAAICSKCHSNIMVGKPSIPKLAIAAGIDFGNYDRIGLEPLTIVEELLISKSRLYVSIVKLIGSRAQERQSAKKGHVIIFPQPDGPLKLAELQRMNSSIGKYN